MSENKEGLQNGVPHLVYISREKQHKHPHNSKAGALNVLVRSFLCRVWLTSTKKFGLNTLLVLEFATFLFFFLELKNGHKWYPTYEKRLT